MTSVESCQSCRQTLMFVSVCHCRNFKVWYADQDEASGYVMTQCHSFKIAAELFIERNNSIGDLMDEYDDGKSFEVFVKNYKGEVKKILVQSTIQVDFSTEEIEEDLEEAV